MGYVRALSDRVAVTYLAEVAVAASHRRQGIGAALIARCLEAFKNTAVFASASPEAVPLLERRPCASSSPRWPSRCRKSAQQRRRHMRARCG